MVSCDIFHLSEIQFITSERGRSLIVYKLFKYYFERTLILTGEKKWRYCIKKCPAFIKILEPSNLITSSNENHNHESCSEQMMQRQQLSTSVKIEKPSIILMISQVKF